MTDNSQFAAHRITADHCQPIIPILGDLNRRQSVERQAGDWVSKNNPQHVMLAVGCTLSRHDGCLIAFQQVSERVRAEAAGIDWQHATVNLGFLLPRP